MFLNNKLFLDCFDYTEIHMYIINEQLFLDIFGSKNDTSSLILSRFMLFFLANKRRDAYRRKEGKKKELIPVRNVFFFLIFIFVQF